MRLGRLDKQPGERRVVEFDYDQLVCAGDSINGATSAATGGLVVTGITYTDVVVRFFVAGGSSGTDGVVTIITTTAGGEIIEDELLVRVLEIT